MKRIFITCTALAALGLALGASRNGVTADTVTERIDHAIHALESVHAPIPHVALHAKALEILQERADAVKAAAAAVNENCVAVIGESRCHDTPPVVAESVPLPRSDPRKIGGAK